MTDIAPKPQNQEPSPPQKRTCLLVLGMHRSGTSALTRSLNLMGAKLPKTIMGKGSANVVGHWESERIRHYNDALFTELDTDWNEFGPIDLTRLTKTRIRAIQEQITALYNSEFGDTPLSALKDPRICRLLPLYKKALREHDIRLVPIICFRNPLSVAHSIKKRDGLNLVWGTHSWLRHVVDAEKNTRGMPRVFFRYDDLLQDWRSLHVALSRLDGFSLPFTPDEIEDQIEGFLTDKLSHNNYSNEDVALSNVTRTWVQDIHQAVQILARSPKSKNALRVFDRVWSEFDISSAAIMQAVKSTQAELVETQTLLEAKINEAESRYEQKTSALLAVESHVDDLKQSMQDKISEHQTRVTELQSENAQLKTQKEQFDEIHAKQQSKIEALHGQNVIDQSRTHYLAAASRAANDFMGNKNLIVPELGVLSELTIQPDDHGLISVKFTDNAPQITLDFSSRPLEVGYYQLLWRVSGRQEDYRNLTLFYDFGYGFQSPHQQALEIDWGQSGYVSVPFTIPQECVRLRLDLADLPGEVVMGAIVLTPLNKIVYYKRKLNFQSMGFYHNKAPVSIAKSIWRLTRQYGPKGAAKLLRDGEKRVETRSQYGQWIKQFDTLTPQQKVSIRQKVSGFKNLPKISVVIPVHNTDPDLLTKCIESVRNQIYPYWELCIADDASSNEATRKVLEEYIQTDSRIKVVFRQQNGHISKATNSALELVDTEWVALLDHDDILAEKALFCVAEAIRENPTAKLIYSDEDKLDQNGVRFDPYFKSDWNYQLFLSQNMINHLSVYRKSLLDDIGGFRDEFIGSQDYDLALRAIEKIDNWDRDIVHIPEILYHWRVIEGSTALNTNEKPYAAIAGEKALNEHLERVKVDAAATYIGYGYRLDYALPRKLPRVSIIIPTRNAKDLTKACIDSIIKKTRYPAYEIVVIDNGSDDIEALTYFQELADEGIAKIIRDDGPFNYSALNNNAVNQIDTELICLMNNDIEVITPDWLSEMVSLALQPNTGAVGAKLYYPDNSIQHGGVIIGLGGVAGHAHHKLARGQYGYKGRCVLTQNLSAVTAACLVVKRKDYLAVGGLNAERLTVAFNDVDLCLKLLDLGRKNIWTPYAELYHHESVSRGDDLSGEKLIRFKSEIEYIQERWSDIIKHDPAYNPNLSLTIETYALAFPPRHKRPWE